MLKTSENIINIPHNIHRLVLLLFYLFLLFLNFFVKTEILTTFVILFHIETVHALGIVYKGLLPILGSISVVKNFIQRLYAGSIILFNLKLLPVIIIDDKLVDLRTKKSSFYKIVILNTFH